MTGDKIFIATKLRNRLLNAAFNRGREVKKGCSEPFSQRQIKSCKVALKTIMRGHFVLADRVLGACPEMRKAVFA